MKPLPNINDDAAMLLRGKRSALASARNDAAESLRDACTHCQSSDWPDLRRHAAGALDAAERLMTLAALWDELEAAA